MNLPFSSLDFRSLENHIKGFLPRKNIIILNDLIQGMSFKPVVSDFYGIAYCYQGSCELKIGLKKSSFHAGQLMLLKPGELYHLKKTVDYNARVLAFHKNLFIIDKYIQFQSLLNLPFFRGGTNNIIDLEKENRTKIIFYLKTISKKEKEGKGLFKEEILKNLLSALIYEIGEIFSEPIAENILKSFSKEEVYYHFEELVKSNYQLDRTVDFYAQKLHITPSYLSEITRQKTGKNALQLIHEKVIYEAKVLVNNTDRNITEIAGFLNFSEPSSFIRFFKRNTGYSPLQYRRKVI